MPLNKSKVYGRGERGLSSARAQGMRSNGNESNSQQTLTMISCNLGTKLSLGLNCYDTGGFYTYKTNTRSRSASATIATSYPTYVYSSCEY